MGRLLIFITLIFTVLQGVNSQVFQDYYNNRQDSIINEGDVYLNLNASTWFYNNEYFNPFYKGYTLIGADFDPSLIYQLNSRLRVSAGTYLHRYYGESLETTVKPLFSIEYHPNEALSVLMGSYKGGENHHLNDVLYSFENHLTNITENGILVRYSRNYLESETWLNWQSFIIPGDTIQEQFTMGSFNRVNLPDISGWKMSIPLSLLAHHAGGQINDNNKPVETLINISEGLKISRFLKKDPLQSASLEFMLFHSLGDYNPAPGWAFSFRTGVQLRHLELNAEYFRGDEFVSFAGNPLYRSRKATGNPAVPFEYGGNTEMLNFKAGFRQKMGINSFLFLRFEGYYFTSTSKLDYSYSIHFQVNDFLKLGSAAKK